MIKELIKIKKFIILSLLFFMLPLIAMAQNVTITGIVKNKTGEALPGVSVVIKNTKIGTNTDFDGRYIIKNVPSNSEIVFSMLSYKTQAISVKNKTSIDVVLIDETQLLDEVVVVGYGTMKRSDLTGSVVSIGSKSIESSVASTIDQVLQGRVAGLQMTQNSGVPGAGTSVQIRGISSLNGTNEPIYVIDGVIISGETGSNTTNVLANINPNDIESLEVLKDASATAIYGAQGANGVIIITMKKGKEGASKVSFNSYIGYQELSRKVDMMNLRQYAEHFNARQLVIDPTKVKDKFSNPSTLGKGTDWCYI
jgi:TonB-dependent SusC/RagA subfamily outer membrane receptor